MKVVETSDDFETEYTRITDPLECICKTVDGVLWRGANVLGFRFTDKTFLYCEAAKGSRRDDDPLIDPDCYFNIHAAESLGIIPPE